MGPEVKAWICLIKSVSFASFPGGPCKNPAIADGADECSVGRWIGKVNLYVPLGDL